MKRISVFKIYLAIILSVILIIIIIVSMKNGNSSTVVKNFESNYGSFEVKVPKNWKCNYNSFSESTVDMEGTPDGGIQILIDKNSFIHITVSRSRIYYNGILGENIQTNEGVTAKTYSYNNDGRINEIQLSNSIGVIIKCNNDIYDKYKKDIMNLVKTIKIK